MAADPSLHPNAPAGGGGPGAFKTAGPVGTNGSGDKWKQPGSLGVDQPAQTLTISGMVAAGGPLSANTIIAVNKAAAKTPPQWKRYVAYADVVKVGGSLAWRANNPGNLRDAGTKIASVTGAVGKFAVFATLEDGRAAQKALYLNRYGDMSVKDAINKLTPPTENDTKKYLDELTKAGVDVEKDVKSQIDILMTGVEANEGLISGTEVKRVP